MKRKALLLLTLLLAAAPGARAGSAEEQIAASILAAPELFGFLGFPGGPELLIVAFIILILFGNRLPSVMRSLGQGITEFKKGVKGVSDEFEGATKIEDDNDKV